MKLKRLAQSTVLLTTCDGKRLLIDPGKYNLDTGKLTLETFPTGDVIVITHKHADHFDLDLLKMILKKSTPMIFTNAEIKESLEKNGITAKEIIEGVTVTEAGFSLTAIRTDHVVRDEKIINFGLVVSADGTNLYHTSDTRFIEPSLLPRETKTKYLLVPISNRGVVMGIDDALVFSSELKPEVVIPIHYDSPKDKDRVGPKEFAEKASSFGIKVRILVFGEEIEL
jgi:L-ascorbate metabolism protein UlaG (beta-lactamase superfamily)